MANRSHNAVNRLPESVRNEVNARLVEGYTYEQISMYLKDMGHNISASSAWRYGNNYLRKFEAVRMAREAARIIAEDNIDRPTTELHEANNALASQQIMELLICDDMEMSDKIKACKSIAELQRAQVANEKLKIDARKAGGEVRAAMNALKNRVFEEIGKNHPDISAEILRIADEVSGCDAPEATLSD